MTLTIQLPDAVELQLRLEAEKRGMPPEEYVQQMIVRSILPEPSRSETDAHRLTHEERLQKFREYLDGIDRSGPLLPPEVFERESFYGGRG